MCIGPSLKVLSHLSNLTLSITLKWLDAPDTYAHTAPPSRSTSDAGNPVTLHYKKLVDPSI